MLPSTWIVPPSNDDLSSLAPQPSGLSNEFIKKELAVYSSSFYMTETRHWHAVREGSTTTRRERVPRKYSVLLFGSYFDNMVDSGGLKSRTHLCMALEPSEVVISVSKLFPSVGSLVQTVGCWHPCRSRSSGPDEAVLEVWRS